MLFFKKKYSDPALKSMQLPLRAIYVNESINGSLGGVDVQGKTRAYSDAGVPVKEVEGVETKAELGC